jgi:hypothetical protein
VTTQSLTPAALALAALVACGIPAVASAASAAAASAAADSTVEVFRFVPAASETLATGPEPGREFELTLSDEWLRAPFGDHLLTDPDQWRSSGAHVQNPEVLADYNRVDPFRLGLAYQVQQPETMMPRLGSLIEYAFGRRRVLYGVQVEQPLLPPGRLAFGVSMVRRTDHSELHQVDDLENSLALLLGRQDYRDYFEREGFGAYLSWRVPDFSTVSVHVRNDHYDSLVTDRGTRSWLQRDRVLRANPAVDVGEAHSLTVRLERLAHQTSQMRAGLYHWIEFQRAGGGLKGDFDYTRALADVRSVVRLTPASTLALRAVGGHTLEGKLPRQKQFTVGGVDGLRAHEFSKYRGDEMLLAQAEYNIGLWRMNGGPFDGGLHALVFVDAGRAWSSRDHAWDVDRQQIQADGGFGLGTSDDDLRIYFARNLQHADSDFVISVRLQRPF